MFGPVDLAVGAAGVTYQFLTFLKHIPGTDEREIRAAS